MPWVAAATFTSAVIGGVTASKTASAAKKAQRRALEAQTTGSEAAIAEQRRQFDISQELTAPRREAEGAALGQLLNVLGIGESEIDISGIQIPGQEFAIGEAGRAVERSAAARGGLVSGNTLAALQERALGITNQNFLSNFLQPLTQLATGQAGQQAGEQALNFGVNVGNLQNQAGINRANIVGQPISSAQGIGNALQGGLANFVLLNQLQGGTPAGGPGGFGGGS